MTLVELLERWRETRSPRVADALDRASEAIDRPPIEGATTVERVAAWRAIAAQRDPHDVGRLVAMQMPRTRPPLETVIRHLVDWSDDPRIAMALVRFVEDQDQLFRVGTMVRTHALVRLGDIRDVRILPRLHALNARRGVTVTAEIAKLEAVVPIEVAMDDAPIATDVAALLEAVARDPADRATLEVLGDALVQRGDPRGQLIALQLAEPSEVRERHAKQLIEKHGRAFAGELDRWFVDEGRLFERGFFAGGQLSGAPRSDVAAADEAAELVRDPAWAFVRVLEIVGTTEALAVALANRAELISLRALGLVGAASAKQLASRTIDELRLRISDDLPLDLPELPALRTLALAGPIPIGRWAVASPLLERIHRLVVTPRRSAGEYVAIAERGGALRELEIDLGRPSFYKPVGWCLRMIRDTAPGPFHRIVITRGAGDRRDSYALLERLRTVPDRWPTEIIVESADKMILDPADAREIETELARFPNVTSIVVPWTRPTAASATPFLTMRVTGFPPTREAIAALWEALAQPYDAFRVNFNAHRPLGDDPIGKIATWIVKPTTRTLLASREGALGGTAFANDGTVTATFPNADFAARFARFAAAVPFAHAIVVLDKGPPYRELAIGRYAPMPPAGWLIAFPKPLRPLVDPEDVRALGVQVFATGDRLTVAVTERPDQLSEPILDRFTLGLRRLAYAGMSARLGFDFVATVREHLAAYVAREHLAEIAMTDLFHVEYQRSNDGILERIHARLEPDGDPPALTLEYKRRTNVTRIGATIRSRDDLVRELAKISALP